MLPMKCCQLTWPNTWVKSRSQVRGFRRDARYVENRSRLVSPPVSAFRIMAPKHRITNHSTAGALKVMVLFRLFMSHLP